MMATDSCYVIMMLFCCSSSSYSSSSSSSKDPGLLVAASSASRDISLAFAYSSIHKHNYNMSDIMLSLVPGTGMLMVRDEIEIWSVFEANLFEEALDKFGKDFALIKEQVLPWKTLNTVIELVPLLAFVFLSS